MSHFIWPCGEEKELGCFAGAGERMSWPGGIEAHPLEKKSYLKKKKNILSGPLRKDPGNRTILTAGSNPKKCFVVVITLLRDRISPDL